VSVESFLALALLASAGLVGGTLNAIAGGGSFLTFAAMVFVGIPSIVANATSAVARFPGALASARLTDAICRRSKAFRPVI
jgi:uncharacterized membrane protein YfcA